MRTNIEIDDELMQKALVAGGQRTKKATVEEALRLLVQIKSQVKLRELRGMIKWEGDLDELRRDRFPDWK